MLFSLSMISNMSFSIYVTKQSFIKSSTNRLHSWVLWFSLQKYSLQTISHWSMKKLSHSSNFKSSRYEKWYILQTQIWNSLYIKMEMQVIIIKLRFLNGPWRQDACESAKEEEKWGGFEAGSKFGIIFIFNYALIVLTFLN